MKRKTFFLLLLLFCVSISACQPSTSLFGLASNPKREKTGIPIIPENWKAKLVNSNESTWNNPDFDELYKGRTPFHASKYVNYRNGIWMYDTDTYYGITDFNWDNSLQRDELLITYYYQIDDYGVYQKIGWEVTYYSKNGVNVSISLEKAKEILASWGLLYP